MEENSSLKQHVQMLKVRWVFSVADVCRMHCLWCRSVTRMQMPRLLPLLLPRALLLSTARRITRAFRCKLIEFFILSALNIIRNQDLRVSLDYGLGECMSTEKSKDQLHTPDFSAAFKCFLHFAAVIPISCLVQACWVCGELLWARLLCVADTMTRSVQMNFRKSTYTLSTELYSTFPSSAQAEGWESWLLHLMKASFSAAHSLPINLLQARRIEETGISSAICQHPKKPHQPQYAAR